ncbi:7-deoxyloganetic acid glucosyltransferase-like [Cynara cardunculus var. scolymus]|uniref:7-deoxyloganetic acid glucosyltransferase-like n=1 Tax=Cynara cardunculus var. scolymus TaxID=59895 RepID=UPI000D62C979|nr:7-deoxyloganetic acid glucosyltransferase-like [Cynara cardunculus var. scolymus]
MLKSGVSFLRFQNITLSCSNKSYTLLHCQTLSISMAPHVLIFPLPMQGPVNCMLKLAELLCLSGISVTVLNTDHIQRTLLRHTNVLSRFSRYPNFHFQTISDGLPHDHPRSSERFLEVCEGMRTVTEPAFREMMVSGCFSSKSASPVTVIIPDGSFSFALDVAEEIQIPLIYFETVSPCALWTYLCLPKLIEAGEVPFNGNDLDVLIRSVPGTETFLRRRDLPGFYRIDNLANHVMQIIMNEAQHVPRAYGVIINTFDELDASILVHMRNLCPNIYCIGPLHTLHKNRLAVASKTTTLKQQSDVSNSLWEENRTCLSWLDMQPAKSVVYVSIGSMARMTVDQFFEIWQGLVNSGKPFLWVQRPGSVLGEYDDSQVPQNLVDETKQRGFIATWVPQEEVLAHPAIGGFLTHGGWNSTMESIMEGVPMICWPFYVDQQVNSRFVSEVWKVGIDIKDTCDRVIIEKAVNDLIHVKRDEFIRSVKPLAESGAQSVAQDGSSYMDLNRLVEDVKSMNL